MNKKIAMIFTLLAVTSMTLTACGGNDNTQASDTSADTTVTTPAESTPDETEDSEASWRVSDADTNVSLPEGEAVKPDDGQPAEDVIQKLRGINCNGKGTSCPDQLAKAIDEVL